jgi:hypothetical protein
MSNIKGYRELSPSEVALINEIKAKAEEVGALVEKLHDLGGFQLDNRWVNIGKTHLQQGFMALVRSVRSPRLFNAAS